MDKVKIRIPKKLQKGIPLEVRPGHTVRLEVTKEPLTVHTGLSLFYPESEHILQMNRAYAEILEVVYARRSSVTSWTVDVDAKVHEVFGEKKQGAARSYNGTYSLRRFKRKIPQGVTSIHLRSDSALQSFALASGSGSDAGLSKEAY
jgi:hypothetical protein